MKHLYPIRKNDLRREPFGWLGLMLVLLALVVSFTLSAQRPTYRGAVDLEERYGLSFMQGKLLVGEQLDRAAAEAKYPAAALVCAQRGFELLELSFFDAAWMDGVWLGQGGGQPLGAVLVSQNDITVPRGEYWQTVIAEFSGGSYAGQGTSYAGNGSSNTTLLIWHERWQGDTDERHCLQSGTWDGSGIFSYVEGTRIEGFQLVGRSKEALALGGYQGFESSGLRMWKPGETTVTRQVFSRDFRTMGIQMYASTPTVLDAISVFDNVVAGLNCTGCWGATIQANISGDDNGRIFLADPYYHPDGRVTQAGGTGHITMTKSETGVASGALSERVWRGQAVEVHGQFLYEFTVVSAAVGGVFEPDAFFIVDPRLTVRDDNGDLVTQSSMLKASVKGFGYRTLLHDLRGTRYAWQGDYGTVDFRWHATAGMDAWPPVASSPGCLDPVAYELSGNPYNNPAIRCKPYRYVVDGPPHAPTSTYLDELLGSTPTDPDPTPPPCEWTCGPWGPCEGGQQTRSCTSNDNCTVADPTPETVRDCTVEPPPPSDGELLRLTAFRNTSGSYGTPVDWQSVTRVRLVGASLLTDPGYQCLMWPASGSSYVSLKPDGAFYLGSVKLPQTPAVLQAGVRYPEVIVELPSMAVSSFLAKAGTGCALRFEADTVVVYGSE